MDRRELIKLAASVLLSGVLTTPTLAAPAGRPIYGGWLDLPEARQQFVKSHDKPFLRQHDAEIKGSGENKQIRLLDFYEKVAGPHVPHYQEIGDCVGQSSALAVDFLTAMQIAFHGKNEEWKGKCSVEVNFAGSRVEIGKGAIRFTGGSTGAWVAEWLNKYGAVLRGKYGDIDLTKYDPTLAARWGRRGVGVPDVLEPIAKKHPVKTVTLVEGWKQACDCIANGYPIILCSNVGFTMETDAEGFLRHTPRSPWGHAMMLGGIDTKSKRQGGEIFNSWGSRWRTGPQHKLGTGPGAFWADARWIDKMCSQEDCYAFSDYVGYPRRDLDYLLVPRR